MDGSSHMGTCMCMGIQRPPTLPKIFFSSYYGCYYELISGTTGTFKVLYGAVQLRLILL